MVGKKAKLHFSHIQTVSFFVRGTDTAAAPALTVVLALVTAVAVVVHDLTVSGEAAEAILVVGS